MIQTPAEPIENLAFATIIEVDGTHIVAELDAHIAELTRLYNGILYPVGQFGSIIKIHFGRRAIYGYVSRLRMKSEFDRERGIVTEGSATARVIEADLFGEGDWNKNGNVWSLNFERGVSTFSMPQQRVYLTPRSELADVFGRGTDGGLNVGEHVGSGGTPCYLDIDELLGKHTAILGSTGSGKSSAVAVVLHRLLAHGADREFESWNPRIVVLDPHNEYGAAFPDHNRLSTDEGTLTLPYWMLDFEETLGLIVGKTEFVATSQSNVVKNALLSARQEGARAIGLDADRINVDSPIPYVLGNPTELDDFGVRNGELEIEGFVGCVNRQRPNNRTRKDHEEYNKIIRKLDALTRDSRIQFMMKPWNGASDGDSLDAVLQQFLGVGHPLCVMDLSGVPNEVAGSASSLVARLLFTAKLWQSPEDRERNPVLLVCEEAHRYVPNRGEAQYGAAREAIQRLAKEGRKYGIGLMLVSQRPSEVDATVLSQCNSWIVLRVTNDTDREHVRSILPDSLSGLTKVLSGLRQREAIAVGQAIALPSRILVRKLLENERPRSHDISFSEGWRDSYLSTEQLIELAGRWRFQDRSITANNVNGIEKDG